MCCPRFFPKASIGGPVIPVLSCGKWPTLDSKHSRALGRFDSFSALPLFLNWSPCRLWRSLQHTWVQWSQGWCCQLLSRQGWKKKLLKTLGRLCSLGQARATGVTSLVLQGKCFKFMVLVAFSPHPSFQGLAGVYTSPSSCPLGGVHLSPLPLPHPHQQPL